MRASRTRASGRPPEPVITRVPYVGDIKFGYGCTLLKRYVLEGLELRRDLLAKLVWRICRKHWGIDFDGPEVLDAKLIEQLIRLGYTLDAVLEFWFRPEHRLAAHSNAAYVRETYQRVHDTVHAPQPLPDMRSGNVITMLAICLKALETEPQRFRMKFDRRTVNAITLYGVEVLALNPEKCHEVYLEECARLRVSAVPFRTISEEMRCLREPYWLGYRPTCKPYTWRFNAQVLQRMKILSEENVLTLSKRKL